MPVSRKRKKIPAKKALPKHPSALESAALKVRTKFRARPRVYLSAGAAVAITAAAVSMGFHAHRAAQRLCVVPAASVLPTGEIYSGGAGSRSLYRRADIIHFLNEELAAVLERDTGTVVNSKDQVVGQLIDGELYRDGAKVDHAQFKGDVELTVLGKRIKAKTSDRFVLSADTKSVQLGEHRFEFSKLAMEITAGNEFYAMIPSGRIKIHSVAMAHRCE